LVETALADALRLAVEGERWEIVVQLAEELAGRRAAREKPALAEASLAGVATRGSTR